MKELFVHSSSHAYKIAIGKGVRHHIHDYLEKEYASILIITDTTVADLYLEEIQANFDQTKISSAVIEAGEASKNITAYYDLQTKALASGLDRNSLIIALGGGVVGDLAGFVASTYMRGIDYIQVPTTILAHDSSVGGKVAINHEQGKNLIGSFHSPAAVIYDVETLTSLGEKEVRSGYAEIVKEALISSDSLFDELMNSKLHALSSTDLEEHILAGIKVKARIVESDEKEASVRKYLNLGHTLGHALEAEIGYGELTHGEAVAIGLLFALYVSEQTFSVHMPYERLYDWLEKNNFPLSLKNLAVNTLISRMKSDKKTVNKTIQMVLLEKVGKPVIREIDDREMKGYLHSFLEGMVKS